MVTMNWIVHRLETVPGGSPKMAGSGHRTVRENQAPGRMVMQSAGHSLNREVLLKPDVQLEVWCSSHPIGRVRTFRSESAVG